MSIVPWFLFLQVTCVAIIHGAPAEPLHNYELDEEWMPIEQALAASRDDIPNNSYMRKALYSTCNIPLELDGENTSVVAYAGSETDSLFPDDTLSLHDTSDSTIYSIDALRRDPSHTPLHQAILYCGGYSRCLYRSLGSQWDGMKEWSTQTTQHKLTPLHYVALLGYYDIMWILINISRDALHMPDVHGRLPLHLAAMTGRDPKMVLDMLILAPETLFIKDDSSETAMQVATTLQQQQVLDAFAKFISPFKKVSWGCIDVQVIPSDDQEEEEEETIYKKKKCVIL